jgi:hypothetical protein
MVGSGSGDSKVFGRFTEQAHWILDLARGEAEWAGHRYLGPPLVAKRALQLASEQAHALGHRLDRLRGAVAAELAGVQR